MYNEEGETIWERSLDAFGKVQEGSHKGCPFMYQGQYYDGEIELAYNRFRYYAPEDGRYISQDPIGLDGGKNFYAYVLDSNTWIDPLGLMPFWKPLKPTGIGHHPIPRTHANSTGMPKLGTKFDSPSWYPNEVEGSDILHKDAHQALKDNGVPFNQKFDGDSDSLIKKTKEAYKNFPEKGTLKIPRSGEVIAENVTLSQSVDESVKWNKKGCH